MNNKFRFDIIAESVVDSGKRHVATLALDLISKDLEWRLPVLIEWLRPNENGAFQSNNRLSWCTANSVGISREANANQICEEIARQLKTIQLCVGLGGQPNTPALSAEADNFALRYSGQGARLSMPIVAMGGRYQ
jgi:hypothetical protein